MHDLPKISIMRLRYLQRAPLPGELFILRWYHTARLVLRMLNEGCFASRFGNDRGEYKLRRTYLPKPHSFYQ